MFNSEGYNLSDIAAVTRGEDGFFGGNGAWWLILLFMFGWGWGGNGGFGGGGNENIRDAVASLQPQRWAHLLPLGLSRSWEAAFARRNRRKAAGHSRATPPQWGVRRRRKWQVNVNDRNRRFPRTPRAILVCCAAAAPGLAGREGAGFATVPPCGRHSPAPLHKKSPAESLLPGTHLLYQITAGGQRQPGPCPHRCRCTSRSSSRSGQPDPAPWSPTR